MDDIHQVPRADAPTDEQRLPLWATTGPEGRARYEANVNENRTAKQAFEDGVKSTVTALGVRNIQQRVDPDANLVEQLGQAVMAVTGQAGRWGESTWDKDAHYDELTKDVPREYWDDIFAQTSLEGAKITKSNIKTELDRAQRIGVSTGLLSAATMAGHMLDIDLPLAIVAGGSVQSAKVAGWAAYQARTAGLGLAGSRRVAGLVAGASGGAQAGALVGGGLVLNSEISTAVDAVGLMLMTTAFGSTLGAAAPGVAFSMREAHKDFISRVRAGDPDIFEAPIRQTEPQHMPITPAMREQQNTPMVIDVESGAELSAADIAANQAARRPYADEDIARENAQRSGSAATDADGVPVGQAAGDIKAETGGQSLSAAVAPRAGFPALRDPLKEFTPKEAGWIEAARDRVVSSQMQDQLIARANNFIDRMGASKLFTVPSGTNDWFTMVRSKSAVLNMLALDVFESTSGYVRGATANAGTLRNMYSQSIAKHMTNIDKHMVKWANDQGERGITLGVTPFGVKRDVQASFYREVMLYVNARSNGQDPNVHPSVRQAGDQVGRDLANEAAYILKGTKSQHSVDGADNLPTDGYYMPYRWDGSRMAYLIADTPATTVTKGKVTRQVNPMRENIRVAMTEGYIKAGTFTDPKLADAVAQAVIDRFVTRGARLDDNVISLFSADGRQYLEQTFRSNGMTEAEIRALMARFDKQAEERGKAGTLRRRNDIDLSVSIPNTSYALVDLMRTDLDNVLQGYARQVGGMAALARQGIRSKADIEDVIAAARAEQRALGEKEVHPDFLRAMFSEFNGGANWGVSPISNEVNQGVGEGIAVAKSATSLSVLTFNGAAQAAEYGNVVMASGVSNFINNTVGPMISAAVRTNNRALLNEIEQAGLIVGRDHELMRPHIDFDAADAQRFKHTDAKLILNRVRETVGKANYIQGYTSFLNGIRTHQQQIAVVSIGAKVMKLVRDNNVDAFSVEGRAFRDLGLDKYQYNRLQAVLPLVKWEKGIAGDYVKEFNFHLWPEDLMVDFVSSLSRGVDQAVQRSLPGETDRWMHTSVGTLLTHLKTFPMLAVQKQFIRNAAQADLNAAGTVFAGFMSAYAAIHMRDMLTGNDRDNVEKMRAAFGYANITGWMPMVADPALSILGMSDLRFNQFGPHSSVFEVPALNTVNALIRTPGAVFNTLTGNETAQDVQTVRALPFIRLVESASRIAGMGDLRTAREARIAGEQYIQSATEQRLREAVDQLNSE